MSFPRDRIKGKRGQELSAGVGSLQLRVQWSWEGARSAEVRRLPGDGGDVATGSLVSSPWRRRTSEWAGERVEEGLGFPAPTPGRLC